MSQRQLAEATGTTQPTINRLETGGQRLSSNWAARLAPHLGVPVTLLLSDEVADGVVVDDAANCHRIDAPWRSRLTEAFHRSGKSARAVSREAGGSSSYVHFVLKGRAEPSIDKLMCLAEVLGVSAAWLLAADAGDNATATVHGGQAAGQPATIVRFAAARKAAKPTEISRVWRARLTDAVEKSGMSASEVSIRAGCSVNYLASIVTAGQSPTVSNFLRLAAALEVSVAWLLGETGAKQVPLSFPGDDSQVQVTEAVRGAEPGGSS